MSYLQRLSDTYANIVQCDLVKNKNVTEESIAHFKQLCDLCLPMNADEIIFAQYIMGSFRRSKSGFLKTLPYKNQKHAINHRAVLLLTTPQLIVEEFDVANLVYMKYVQNTNEYVFSKPHMYPGVVQETKEPKEKTVRYPKSQKKYNNKHYENRHVKKEETNHRLAKRLDEFIISDIVAPTEKPEQKPEPEKKSWADSDERSEVIREF
jgi:hypothetical protein